MGDRILTIIRFQTRISHFLTGTTLFDRPFVTSPAIGPWLVMMVGIVVGYLFYEPHVIDAISIRPLGFDRTSSYMINYEVYHVAAEASLAGVDFYDVHPERLPESYVYLYPPITLVLFYPMTIFDVWTGYVIFSMLTVIAALASTWAVVTYVEDHGRRLGWLDCGLIFVFFVGSIYAAGTVIFGNVNLWLAAFVSIGFFALLRGHERTAGAMFAVAALFKVFPALIGLWFLRTRAWTATATAIAVGVGGLVGGIVLFGIDPTRVYFATVVSGRTESDLFVGGYPVTAMNYVTAQRPVSWLVWSVYPDATIEWLYIATAITLLLILAVFYLDLSRPMDRHAAILASVAVAVLAFPALRWYLVLLYLPILVLAYCWSGPGYFLFVGGGILFTFSVHPRHIYSTLESPQSLGIIQQLNSVVPGIDVGWVLAISVTPLVPLAGIGSPQLWGIVCMLSACVISKRAAGTDPISVLGSCRSSKERVPLIEDSIRPPYGPDADLRDRSEQDRSD